MIDSFRNIVSNYYSDIITIFALVSTVLIVRFNQKSSNRSQSDSFHEKWMERIRENAQNIISSATETYAVGREIKSMEDADNPFSTVAKFNEIKSIKNGHQTKALSKFLSSIQKFRMYFRTDSESFKRIQPTIQAIIDQMNTPAPKDFDALIGNFAETVRLELEAEWQNIEKPASTTKNATIIAIISALSAFLFVTLKDYSKQIQTIKDAKSESKIILVQCPFDHSPTHSEITNYLNHPQINIDPKIKPDSSAKSNGVR